MAEASSSNRKEYRKDTRTTRNRYCREPADNDHRARDRGRKLGGEREREWNELVAIYPPARITVSAFSVDIIVTQLDYNAPPPSFLNRGRSSTISVYTRGTFRDRYPLGVNASTPDSFRESRYRCTSNGHTVCTRCTYIYIYISRNTERRRQVSAEHGRRAKGSKRKKGNAKELELERAGLGEREKRERRTVAVGTPHRRYVLLLRGGCCSITSIDACSFIPRNNR